MKIKCGSLTIEFHYSFFLFLFFYLYFDRWSVAPYLLLSVMLHEIGHLLAMYLLKAPPQEIHFRPSGIDIRNDRLLSKSYTCDLIVCAAGPLANLLVAVLWRFWAPIGFYNQLFCTFNLLFMVFNLLPLEILDGGRMLSAILSRNMQPQNALKIMRIFFFLCLTAMFVGGFLLFFRRALNPSYLAVIFYLILASVKQPEKIRVK